MIFNEQYFEGEIREGFYVEEKMKQLKNELQDMSRDSDFPEEGKEIDKYVQMLDRVM